MQWARISKTVTYILIHPSVGVVMWLRFQGGAYRILPGLCWLQKETMLKLWRQMHKMYVNCILIFIRRTLDNLILQVRLSEYRGERMILSG